MKLYEKTRGDHCVHDCPCIYEIKYCIYEIKYCIYEIKYCIYGILLKIKRKLNSS